MEGNPCQVFFEEHSGAVDLVPRLIATAQGELWSTMTASRHSPGVVSANEPLGRHIVHDFHWDEEKQWIKMGFYDDLASRGLSVNRLDIKALPEVMDDGAKRIEGRVGKTYIGVLEFTAEAVRQVVSQVAGVAAAAFDTSMESDVSHADVCYTCGDKQARKEARALLFEQFKDGVRRAV